MEYTTPAAWEMWLKEKHGVLPQPWPEEGRAQIGADGSENVARFRYLEINPPERLEFTWEFPGDSASDEPQVTIVSVTFEAVGDATQLIIEHRKLSSGQAVDMDIGWTSSLESLAGYLTELQDNNSVGG